MQTISNLFSQTWCNIDIINNKFWLIYLLFLPTIVNTVFNLDGEPL